MIVDFKKLDEMIKAGCEITISRKIVECEPMVSVQGSWDVTNRGWTDNHGRIDVLSTHDYIKEDLSQEATVLHLLRACMDDLAERYQELEAHDPKTQV
jgi:hypothetical protein